MSRVFLDANVLFSAAYREGAGLCALWELRGVALVTSDYAIEEARRNLVEDVQHARLAVLLAAVEVVRGTFDAVPVPANVSLPDDDLPILRAAIGSRCTHLLTGNLRDFGALFGRRVGRVTVLRPAVFLVSPRLRPRRE